LQGLLTKSGKKGLLRKLKWHRFGKEIPEERAQYGTLWDAVSIEEAGEQSLGIEDHASTRTNNIDGIFELPRIQDSYRDVEQSLYASYNGSRAGLPIILKIPFGKLQLCACVYRTSDIFTKDFKAMLKHYLTLPFSANIRVHSESQSLIFDWTVFKNGASLFMCWCEKHENLLSKDLDFTIITSLPDWI